MNTDSCLMSYFIINNNVKNTCDFIPKDLGNGVVIYEVIRIIEGKPIFFAEHINRFINSIYNLGFSTKLLKVDIAQRIYTLIEINKFTIGNIRFQISFDSENKDTFSAWVTPHSYPTHAQYAYGVDTVSAFKKRKNPNLKVRNQSLIKEISDIIKQEKVYEVLLLNDESLITEGSRSNIFFVNKTCIHTPKTINVLPGITRQKVLEIASLNRIPIEETDINISNIGKYDGAFITGTSPKILPIARVDSVKFNPVNIRLVQLMKLFDNCIDQYLLSIDPIELIDQL